jgi:hypothetical protein
MTSELYIHDAEEQTPAVEWPRIPPLIWRDPDGSVCAYGQSVGGYHWVQFPRLATYRFAADAPVTDAFPVIGARRDLVADTFQRSVLPLLLHTRGQEVLHASAVATPAGVIAFCAASETGKSTLACGLSRRGYTPWGDDAVVLARAVAAWNAVPYPFRFRLRPGPAALFAAQELAVPPAQPATAPGQPQPMAALFLLTRIPPTAAPNLPATGPAPAPADASSLVEVARLAPAGAFPRLLAQAYCFSLADPARKRRMVEHYLDLAAHVPVFDLRLADGLENLPAALDAVERTIAEL